MFILQNKQYDIYLPQEFILTISLDHPVFKGNPPKLNQEYKFTFKKVDKDKNFFRNGDFIEVEEINNESKLENLKQKFSEEIMALNQQLELTNSDLSPEYRN